jgi:hypothetical protein
LSRRSEQSVGFGNQRQERDVISHLFGQFASRTTLTIQSDL